VKQAVFQYLDYMQSSMSECPYTRRMGLDRRQWTWFGPASMDDNPRSCKSLWRINQMWMQIQQGLHC